MTDLKQRPVQDMIDVLIVGAGLSGLMMAVQLLRHGVYPLIIDRKLGPDKDLAPVVLYPRTMELLHALGLDTPVIQQAHCQREWHLPALERPLDLDALPDLGTAYRGRWVLTTAALEQILIDHLTRQACKIHWGTAMARLVEGDTGVSVEITEIPEHGIAPSAGHSGGTSRQVSWVIGADGSHSTVRGELGFEFQGNSFRVASKLAARRSFLIGDAAYRDSQAIPEGVNHGFQDAWNLGWKLAGVVSGRWQPGLLRSYHAERYPSGITRRGARFDYWLRRLLAPPPTQTSSGFIRKILQGLIRGYYTSSVRQSDLFRQLSGLSLAYRHTGLALHYSASEQIKAGDRFPWQMLFDEKLKSTTDTREIFRKPGFVLVVMGNVGAHMIHIMGQWIRQKYPQGLGLYYIPYSPRNQAFFDLFETPPGSAQLVLVRPDTYIAYMTNAANTFLVDHYLEHVVGWKKYLRQ